MPRLGGVRTDVLIQQCEAAQQRLDDIGEQLREARCKSRARQISKIVLKDSVYIAKTLPTGLESAADYIKRTGIVDDEALVAALDKVREALSRPADMSGDMGTVSNDKNVDHAAALSRRARLFLLDYKLKDFVENSNMTKRVLPGRRQVWEKRLQLDVITKEKAATPRGQRQWARRWRKRVSITIGRVSCRESLPEAELQAKVAVKLSIGFVCQGY